MEDSGVDISKKFGGDKSAVEVDEIIWEDKENTREASENEEPNEVALPVFTWYIKGEVLSPIEKIVLIKHSSSVSDWCHKKGRYKDQSDKRSVEVVLVVSFPSDGYVLFVFLHNDFCSSSGKVGFSGYLRYLFFFYLFLINNAVSVRFTCRRFISHVSWVKTAFDVLVKICEHKIIEGSVVVYLTFVHDDDSVNFW